MDTAPRIRIMFVIGTLDVGGAERQLVEMVTNLSPRFEPLVCCLSSRGALASELERAGVAVRAIGLRGVRQKRGFARLWAALAVPGAVVSFLKTVRAFRPHVLHGVLFHAYVLAAFAGAVARVPVIVASRRSLGHFKRSRALYHAAEGWANRRTDVVIANSEAVRRDTLNSEGLPERKVIVIHNGLDVDAYERPADRALRESLGAGFGLVALTVANLIAYKGHTYLLKAWADVCQAERESMLWLAGDGPARASLEQEAARLGLGSRVRFLGVRSDVPALLSAADMLVHPSLEEGFSNALLEAMAAGKPVVATDVGGNAEALVNDETGVIVPARDPAALAAAILRVWRLPDRGGAMGVAGRRRARERFSRGAMVTQYEAAYRDLLARKRVRWAEETHDVRHRRTR